MRKYLLVFPFLSLFLIPVVTAQTSKDPLYDINGHTYETAIRYLAEHGIIQGYPDGSYQPNRNVNRAEFTKIIVGAKLGSEPTNSAANCFPDVRSSDWFSGYVCYAKANGIIGGYPDGNFKPANNINLAEAAKILVNTLEVKLANVQDKIWYRPFIESLQNQNFIPLSLKKLDQTVNRAEMAELVWRIREEVATKSGSQFVFQDVPSTGADGQCSIPSEAQVEDTSHPDHVIGNGTPASCTSQAVVDTIAQGGKIIFNCGPDPVTIKMQATAKVFNNTGPEIVIDGGGLVTLDGQNQHRILYMNTCDQNQVWTTPHCQNQDHPRLTVQNITLMNGNSQRETEYKGGGAVWVRGGRFKVANSSFHNNAAVSAGPDVGGGAISVYSQYNSQPVYVVNSTFGGGAGLGNSAANGGALSSIGVSWTILNSLFSHNSATGSEGSAGGGSGGAIYNDGNTMTLSLCGTEITQNKVNSYGAAIFFVTNDKSGNIRIENSYIHDNIGGSWHIFPGIAMHSDTVREIINSTIE